MDVAQLVAVMMQGGFTALAALLVWQLVSTSECDRRAAKEREERMATRIDTLEQNLVDLTERGVKAQNDLSTALRELKETLDRGQCACDAEVSRAV